MTDFVEIGILGSLHVDYKIKCGWLNHRQVASALAFQNACEMSRSLAQHALHIRSIRNEAACINELSVYVHIREPIFQRKIGQLISCVLYECERLAQYYDAVCSLSGCRDECRFEVADLAYLLNMRFEAKFLGSCNRVFGIERFCDVLRIVDHSKIERLGTQRP